MRNVVVASLLVAVMLAGVGAGYLVGSANERTATATVATTITSTAGTSTVYQDQGGLLRLQVQLNSSTIRPGGAIFAEIVLLNQFGMNLSVIPPNHADPTIGTWNGYDYVCGGGEFSTMVGYALFRGHFDSGNLSSAGNPLALAPPVAIPCAVFPSPSLFIFLPHGNATWAYWSSPSSPASYARAILNASTRVSYVNSFGGTMCGGGNSLYGYWDQNPVMSCDSATTNSTEFHYFPPGQYTLAAEAAWGQQAFGYFSVS